MSSTQYYVAQSLDGYIAETDGGLDWLLTYGADAADEGTEAGASGATDGGYDRFYAQVGALAMGSGTYEWMLEHVERWPYGELPAWVFTSRELPVQAGADVRFARGPIEPVHAELRAAAGDRNVWVIGGGELASQYAEAGLLDELLLTVVPVVLGDGIPTFARRLERGLRRTGATPFRNGMTELRFELER